VLAAKPILLATLLISVTVDMKSQKALNGLFLCLKFIVQKQITQMRIIFNKVVDSPEDLTDNQSQQSKIDGLLC